jgi:DNA polymerase-1
MYDKQYAEEILGADCTNCPLRIGGKFIPSLGPDNASIAFVGEAPGIQEARTGISFSGSSGKLLEKVSSTYGINREEVLLTNATLCRPADGQSPTKAAITACRPRLLQELQDRGADTVVAMGNSAAFALLGVEGITKLRVGPGRESEYPELKGVRIIPTVHPAACLRQSDMFPSLISDIGKVINKNVNWNEPEYEVLDDPVEASEFLRWLQGRAGSVVIDIEVDIEKDTAFDHPDRYGLLCVGIAYEEGRAVVIGERACQDGNVRSALGDALRASFVVAQNGKFDLAGLNPVIGDVRLGFDTMLAHYCLDERSGIHGLKQMAVEYLGAPLYDEEIKKYVGPRQGYGVIPKDILYKYNAYDAVCTYSLYLLFSEQLERSNLRRVHDHLVEASNELVYLELNGISIDGGYIEELTKKYLASLEEIESSIDKILIDAGYKAINPRSPKQIKEALLFLRCRVDSTNVDTIVTIIETLEARKQIDVPLYHFAQTLLKHRREAKLYGTYVKGIASRRYKGRVYPTFLLHGTTTGRLACRNPNLQNVPRESSIKKLFVPSTSSDKSERLFVQADYSQAELRVLTWLAKDEYFREILNDSSRDLFDELTPILYPNTGSKKEMSESSWKELRIRVKAFVYGLGYGRTEYSIAKEYKLSTQEAKAVKNRFFDAIPAIVEWQKWVKKQVWDGNDLITPFGRHRRFHLITDENWKSIQNEAMAFLPQSTSSDICLRAMTKVSKEIADTDAYIRNIVHDSILIDCRANEAEDISKILNSRMIESAYQVVGDYVKFATDVKIGSHWGEV